MNQLQRNFRTVIENWVTTWRLHRKNRAIRKQIRRHGKELKEAIRQANEMHKATGKAYYVLPDHNGQLRVLDKMAVKNLKRFKVMSEQVTVMDLLTEAEYHTINSHFILLFHYKRKNLLTYQFFRGTILEAMKYVKDSVADVEILGGFERVCTIKDGKVIKH
jgi:K+ transporter